MLKQRKFYCVFCGEEIYPEEGDQDGHTYYGFSCENESCQAEYTSFGRKIPDLQVFYRPFLVEIDLEPT